MHYFVHIPKTAGTSLRKAAEDYFGASRVIYDYGASSAVTSTCVREYLYGPDGPNMTGLVQTWQASQPALVAGHQPLDRFASLVGLGNVLTFLRDPLARSFSEYLHRRRRHGFEGSFRDHFSEKTHISRQLKVLSGVPFQALGMVGITERYRESLSLINEQSGWRLKRRKVNKAGWFAPKLDSISAADRAEFIALNTADLLLYETACRELDQRIRLHQSGQPYVHGAWSLSDAGQIRGWAWWAGERSEEPVALELWCDGQRLEEQHPVQRTDQFADHGLPRAGQVGFVFDSAGEQARASGAVEVRVARTGQVLSRI